MLKHRLNQIILKGIPLVPMDFNLTRRWLSQNHCTNFEKGKKYRYFWVDATGDLKIQRGEAVFSGHSTDIVVDGHDIHKLQFYFPNRIAVINISSKELGKSCWFIEC